jgi:hypothetical protein
MRRAGVIVLAAIVASIASGCGGGGGGGDRLSKSEYEQKMSAIGKELQDASAGIDLTNTSDLDRLADEVGKFRVRLEDAANDVDDLNPPENAEEETAKIADALHAFADEFDTMEKAARKGDVAALQKAQQAVVSEGTEAQEAAKDLKDKGYDIGDLGAD